VDGWESNVGASERSVLLQKDLPRELSIELSRVGITPESVWLCADTDLNLAGGYEQVWLAVSAEALVTLAQPTTRDQPAIRQQIARKDIQEIRTRQGVGGGFLQATVEGVFVDVLAYSNARADIFHKVSSKLQPWLKGEPVEVGPADDVDPRHCPKCGMTLQFKGDVCRRCVDRGAVMVRVFRLMRPYAGKAALMMALVLIGIGIALIPQQLVRILIDYVLAPEQAHNAKLAFQEARWWLLALVGALFGTYLLGAVTHMAMQRLASYVGTQITYDMRKRVFDRLVQLSIDYYDRYNVGQLISRVTGDTAEMQGFVHQLTTGFLEQIIRICAVGAVLFIMDWRLALFTLIPVPLVAVGAAFFWKRIYPRYYRVWDSNSKLAGVLNTILSGMRVVKAFGQEPREQERFSRSSSYVRNNLRGVQYSTAIFNPTIGFVFQLGSLIVWFWGGQWVIQGHMTLGALQAFLGYLGMFYGPIGNLTQLTNWLTGFLTAAQRTFEILDTPIQIAEADKPVAVPEMRGGIVFEHVTFGYDRHQPVLKDVSFSIAPGERIGIVGKSGSGKTTIVNLVSRFYDIDEGRILIDGVDIHNVQKTDLRRQIGVVLQEPFLFRGTIYDNLTYGLRETTPEAVVAAAKAANCHDFIMRHPLGYDTYVGERGAGLSGGERQRISIARALLYDPRVLILDEATSNVDTESEKLIQDALKRITQGRTTIAIAHRLSTLKNSDRIFVVERGRIIETGTHEDLMEAKGTYYNLVKIQTELSREKSVDDLDSHLKDEKRT
jgi:ATP-binding cassette subfamily B protein